MTTTTTMIRVAAYSGIIAMGLIVHAATVPGAAAQSATVAKAKPTSTEIAARETECKAKPFHLWQPPRSAGAINPKNGQTYKRDSSGSCRIDTKAVRRAIEAGTIKG